MRGVSIRHSITVTKNCKFGWEWQLFSCGKARSHSDAAGSFSTVSGGWYAIKARVAIAEIRRLFSCPVQIAKRGLQPVNTGQDVSGVRDF